MNVYRTICMQAQVYAWNCCNSRRMPMPACMSFYRRSIDDMHFKSEKDVHLQLVLGLVLCKTGWKCSLRPQPQMHVVLQEGRHAFSALAIWLCMSLASIMHVG